MSGSLDGTGTSGEYAAYSCRWALAGGRQGQSCCAAWRDGHAQCLVQRRQMGLELRRRGTQSLPRLLREDADKPRDSQLRHLPSASRSRLDQRQGLSLSRSKGRGTGCKRRGRHQPLQSRTPQALHAEALCSAGNEGTPSWAVRRDAAARRVPLQPQGGRLLSEVPDGGLGHRIEERLCPQVPGADIHRACQRAHQY